jgi:hypothetical protein
LLRGTVIHWVEHDLRDFNLARDIHDVMRRTDLSDDARLLHTIVIALPGIPPIWKGKVITKESLIHAATRALNDDSESLNWLLSIYKENVLEALGSCGNADMSTISAEWSQAVNSYRELWERAKGYEDTWRRRPGRHSGDVPDVAYLMYLAPIRMNIPSLNTILPDLVLALYVPAFAQTAKKAVIKTCTQMEETCSWYSQFVVEAQDSTAIFWSVSQRLMPFALDDASKEQTRLKQVVRNAASSEVDVPYVTSKMMQGCRRLLDFELFDTLNVNLIENLRSAISEWLVLSAWVKGLDHDNVKLRALTDQLDSITMRAMQLQAFIDKQQHELEVNAIWLKGSRLGYAAMIIIAAIPFSQLLALLLVLALSYGIYARLRAVKVASKETIIRLRRMLESVRDLS